MHFGLLEAEVKASNLGFWDALGHCWEEEEGTTWEEEEGRTWEEEEGMIWEEEEGMTWEEEEGRTAQTALAVQHTPNTCLLHSLPPSIVEVGQLVSPYPTHLPRPPCDATVQLSA